MNNETEKKINIELILEIIIILLIAMLSRFAFGNLIFLIPAVACVFSIKYSFKESIISLIIALLVLILIDRFYGLMILIQILPMSIVFSYAIKLRKKPKDVILISSLVLFLCLLISLNALTAGSELDFTHQLKQFLDNQLATQIDILESMNLEQEVIENFKITQENVYNYILQILPSILIVYALAIGYINYNIAKYTLRKLGIGIREIAPFSRFSVPSNFGIGVFSVFILMLILRNIDGVTYDVLLINLTAVLGLIFILQGLSVVDFFLKKRKTKTFLRVILMVLIVLLAPLLTPITILGCIDMIFDLRKLKRPRKS